MRKLFLQLIGVGLGSFALCTGPATAVTGRKTAIDAESGVIAAHYRGWGYHRGYYGRGYFGRSYRHGYWGHSYGRGYWGGPSYGYGYWGRSYGRGYYGRHY